MAAIPWRGKQTNRHYLKHGFSWREKSVDKLGDQGPGRGKAPPLQAQYTAWPYTERLLSLCVVEAILANPLEDAT